MGGGGGQPCFLLKTSLRFRLIFVKLTQPSNVRLVSFAKRGCVKVLLISENRAKTEKFLVSKYIYIYIYI